MEKVLTKGGNEIQLITPCADAFDILVVAVVHGDEPQGKFLIDEYLKNKSSNLAFIPALNPDGFLKNQRVNLNGVDINRNFPAKNWEKTAKNEFWGGDTPASEIETRFLINTIEKYAPKLILALHAPFKTVNYDGEALKYAEQISKIINYPVQDDIGYPTPGSLGVWAGIERKIPVITLELDEKCSVFSLISPVFDIFEYLSNLVL